MKIPVIATYTCNSQVQVVTTDLLLFSAICFAESRNQKKSKKIYKQICKTGDLCRYLHCIVQIQLKKTFPTPICYLPCSTLSLKSSFTLRLFWQTPKNTQQPKKNHHKTSTNQLKNFLETKILHFSLGNQKNSPKFPA